VSDHSSDIIRTLYNAMKERGINVVFDAKVLSVESAGDTVSALTYSIKDDPIIREEFDSIIVCTGGVSYPSTGSTGDGYGFAKAMGHTIKETLPSLVPFEVKEDWCRQLQGLSLKNVALKLYLYDNEDQPSKKGGKKNKPVYDGFGEMLFTHFGISGPLVLTASCQYDPKKKAIAFLDLKPALTIEQLDKRVLRDFEDGLNKQFKNVLGGLFPSKLIPVMVELSGIDPEKPVNEITRQERLDFVQLIKNLTMEITGTRSFNEAIITRGGVNVKEINPSTMESRLVRGLYFAGEVLDVDAETGGFNLQIAWSTGHLAGTSAAQE
jgi:predicted Rossmann fold flavoprotein